MSTTIMITPLIMALKANQYRRCLDGAFRASVPEEERQRVGGRPVEKCQGARFFREGAEIFKPIRRIRIVNGRVDFHGDCGSCEDQGIAVFFLSRRSGLMTDHRSSSICRDSEILMGIQE